MTPAGRSSCRMRARHNILINLAPDLGSTRDLRLRNPSVDTWLLSPSLSKLLLHPQEKPMATTRTPCITVLADGRRFIDGRRQLRLRHRCEPRDVACRNSHGTRLALSEGSGHAQLRRACVIDEHRN